MANIAFGAAMNGTTSIAPTVRIAFKSSISDNLWLVMIELKGNDNQKQKASQPCTHVYFCNKSVSARNGCYRISSVRGWKVISHLVFISPKDTVRGVKGNTGGAWDIHQIRIYIPAIFLLPVILPYMALYLIWKHFPELKGEGYDFKYLYFWVGHKHNSKSIHQ